MSEASTTALIVGAGMNGGAMALALARSGIDVCVIESRPPLLDWPAGDYDLRVSALTRASQNLLDKLGAWDEMRAERIAPYRAMHVWDAAGRGTIHFEAQEIGEPDLGHIVENRVTTKALWQRLQALDKVRLIENDELVAFERTSGARARIRAELASGRRIHAEVLIGADGARSKVRQLSGIACTGWDYDQHALVATIETEQPHQATAWQRFLPSGPLALLPLDAPRRCSIVWSTAPDHAEELLELPEAAFNRQLTSASEARLGRILGSGPRAVFPLRRSHASAYVAPGVALIGDAAHTIHPLAGQGVNLGFLDVAELHRALLNAMRRQRPLGDLAALRRYERARKADNLLMQAGMDGFKRLFSNTNPLLRMLRDNGMNLIDHSPPLKRLIMRQALEGRGSSALLHRPATP